MWLMCSLWQTDPAQQVGVAGIGAYTLEGRLYCEIRDAGRTLLVSPFKQPEGLVFVTESHVNHCKLVRIDISVQRHIREVLRSLHRISPLARNGENPPKETDNELVLCSCGLVLIGNFVRLGKGLRIHALYRISVSKQGPNPRVWI